jgi:holo-[acyl-carrier protein] synthase
MECEMMIVGIGVDICDIGRLANIIRRASPLFYERLLSEAEYQYYQTILSLEEKAKWLAGVFASKEAILKAAGTGIDGRYGFNTIDTLAGFPHHPQVCLPALICQKWGDCVQCHVSLIYSEHEVIAFAILET